MNWENYLARNPHESIEEVIRKIDSPPLEMISTEDLSPAIDALYRTGRDKGVSTGWPSVDAFYRIAPGFVTVVTGWPNMGKSTFVDNLAVNTMQKHHWRWLFFSAENRPYETHWAGLAELYTGQPFDKDHPFQMSVEDLDHAKAFFSTHCWHVRIDDAQIMTLRRILDVGRHAIAQHRIHAMVIDPWNEVDHSRPYGQSETEYISAALSHVRSMARDTHIHIFVVAHPAKADRPKNTNALPTPTLHDVAGSAHFWNKADYGLCVDRDLTDKTGETFVYVQKARHRWVAHLGSVAVFHDWRTNRYIDPLDRQRARFTREPGDDDV